MRVFVHCAVTLTINIYSVESRFSITFDEMRQTIIFLVKNSRYLACAKINTTVCGLIL
jgi:hypothetical protein